MFTSVSSDSASLDTCPYDAARVLRPLLLAAPLAAATALATFPSAPAAPPATAPSLTSAPRAAEDPASGVPDRVVVNPTEDTATSVMVTWRTAAGLEDHRAQVRLPGRSGADPAVREFAAWNTETAAAAPGAEHHSALLEGLAPGTRYKYRVGGAAGWSPWAEVRTATGESDPFTFLYFGDAQNGLGDLWPPVVAAATAAEPQARLSLHEGDQINEADNDAEWGQWFRGLDGLSASTLTLTSPGNHEYSGDQLITAYRAHYEYPLNGPLLLRHEDVYFVDYQGVRFISLNANQQLGAPDQAIWLRRVALTENPMDWTVVFFHHPVFSASEGRDNPTLRAFWLPTFERLGIDLVLQGHDHTYARGHLTENETGPGTHVGPTYVVAVAGSKYYDLAPADDNVWTRNGATRAVAHAQTSTYQAIDVTRDRLVYRSVIAAKGEASTSRRGVGDLLDAFTITRGADGVEVVEEGLPARVRVLSERVRGDRARVLVARLTAPGYRPTGRLSAWVGEREVAAGRLRAGTVRLVVRGLPRRAGSIELRYSGDGRARPATTAVPLG
jgi:hypothetical protein